jgi:hypothetical protein
MSSAGIQNTIEFLGGPYDGRRESAVCDDAQASVRLPWPPPAESSLGRILRASGGRFVIYELETRFGRRHYRFVGRELSAADLGWRAVVCRLWRRLWILLGGSP